MTRAAPAGRPVLQAVPVVAAAAASIAVLALFVAPYASDPSRPASGYDTPLYQYHANAISHDGAAGLDAWRPAFVQEHGSRVTTALLWSALGAIAGRRASSLAFLWPAAMAVTIGLAAAAFARIVWRESRWAMPLYVLVVGASMQVARTAGGSLDNLTVDPVLLVAAAVALAAAGHRGSSVLGAGFLVAAAVPIHWVLATTVGALLGAVALMQIPEGVRRRRGGDPWHALPSIRLGSIVVGGLAGGWLSTVVLLSWPDRLPALRLEKVTSKDAARSTGARAWIQGAAAAAGAPRFLRADPVARWGAWFMLLWALTVPVAAVALHVLDLTVPSYRVQAFGLALPMLASAAIAWCIGAAIRSVRHRASADRRGRVMGAMGAVGAAILVPVLVAGTLWTWRLWDDLKGVLPDGSDQAAVAGSYLASTAPEGPAVFVTTLPKPRLPDRVVRAAMPPDGVRGVYVVTGRIEDLAAGRPSVGEAPIAAESASTWAAAGPALDAGAPILQLAALTPGAPPIPGSRELAPGVFLVRGPDPASPLDIGAAREEQDRPLGWTGSLGGSALLVLVLGLAGSGWSWAITPLDTTARVLAAAPIGTAVTSFGALVVDELGLGRSRPAWLAAGLAISGAGWLLAAYRARERRDHDRSGPARA